MEEKKEDVQNQIVRLSILKLNSYKRFIRKLQEIDEGGIVSEKDYRELRSLFQEQLMPYLKKETSNAVITNLTAVGRCVGTSNENFRLREELRAPVTETVNILMENLGFTENPDETVIKELEKTEDELFPRLFKQAVKEVFDNVLVNHSDYELFTRGEYIREKDGEYIVFPLINDHPVGCKIMIGPFSKTGPEILFKLYVPRYIQTKVPKLALNWCAGEISSYPDICVEGREMPLSVSRPLGDSCLIELEQEDSYNGHIPSFSFDGPDSLAPYRHNYAETVFALGQRVKYIFLHARVSLEGMHIYEYITRLKNIDPFSLYPAVPWKLSEDGDMVF
jgi:hypothetical protein